MKYEIVWILFVEDPIHFSQYVVSLSFPGENNQKSQFHAKIDVIPFCSCFQIKCFCFYSIVYI